MRYKEKIENKNVKSRPPEFIYPQSLSERLSFVQGVMKEASEEDLNYAVAVDKDFLDVFTSELPSEPSANIIYWLRAMEQEMLYIIIREKMRWCDDRPYVCAKSVGIELCCPIQNRTTGVGPGYPSGHAAIARLFAKCLSLIFPDYWNTLFNVSNRIAWSRLQLGVHFLRDIEEGRYLGDKFFENIKQAYGGEDKLLEYLRISDRR